MSITNLCYVVQEGFHEKLTTFKAIHADALQLKVQYIIIFLDFVSETFRFFM